MKVSIIGLGFVGSSMYKSFTFKKIDVNGYDKYKEGGIGTFESCLHSDIIFLALPTLFNENKCSYDKDPIYETCAKLIDHNFEGFVIIKSTIEPETTNILSKMYSSLKIIHNPEFLSASTAFEDFHNQKQIVLGKGDNVKTEELEIIRDFYQKYYPDADISLCESTESESMKLFANSFYSVKIQFFNELYLLCQKTNTNFDIVKDLMLKNNWINPMHTNVPGRDGQLSYGGFCFPKDTNALFAFMNEKQTNCKVLEATIQERNQMRNDHENVIQEETLNE